MIFQFVSFSAINILASAFNYLFQYFASLKLDRMSFSIFMSLLSAAGFFSILSTISRNHFTLLFFEEKFFLSSRLKRIIRAQNLYSLLFLVAGVLLATLVMRDDYTFWQIFFTAALIYFTLAASPYIGMLQAEKDYNRIAMFSLAGSLLKLAAGGFLLAFASFHVRAEHFLFFMTAGATLIFVLFYKASSDLHTRNEETTPAENQALLLSIVGTLSVALVSTYDSILFIHVLKSEDAAVFGRFVLLGKIGMVAFELLIFTLFPWFLEEKKISLLTMAGFILFSVTSYFALDFVPVPKSFHPELLVDYWKQIISVGLASILLNFLMARKKLPQLILALAASLGITIFVFFSRTDLPVFIMRNKLMMTGMVFLLLGLSLLPGVRSEKHKGDLR